MQERSSVSSFNLDNKKQWRGLWKNQESDFGSAAATNAVVNDAHPKRSTCNSAHVTGPKHFPSNSEGRIHSWIHSIGEGAGRGNRVEVTFPCFTYRLNLSVSRKARA